MAKVGVTRAVKLTGKSKSTIQRAMKDGKLSFETGSNNRRVIDVSELERVFGLDEREVANDRKKPSAGMANVAELERAQLRVKALEDQLFLLNQQVDDVKEQREDWKKQAQQLAITHQTTQDQAQSFKNQAETAQTEIEKAKQEASATAQELTELKTIATKMKQKILQQKKLVEEAQKPKGFFGLFASKKSN